MGTTKDQTANWVSIGPARWYDCMLGKYTDRKLAMLTGTTEKRIYSRRRDFGIKAYSISQAIEPYLALLGSESDGAVAALCGASVRSVRDFRQSRNIPPRHESRPRPTQQRLPADPLRPYTALLGKVPDADVARLSGLGVEEVRSLRESFNLPEVDPIDEQAPAPRVKDFHGPLLGYESLLGTVSDAKVSREVGVPYGVVVARRIFLDIPPYQRIARASRYKHLIGVVSDSVLAKLAGVSRTRIADMRKGIEHDPKS